MVQNKRVIFASVPNGYPVAGKDLVLETQELDLTKVPPGGVVTKNFYFSLDPYLRGRMRPAEVKSYTPPFTPGEPLSNNGIGRIIASDHPELKEGDWVVGYLGLEELSVHKADAANRLEKINNPYNLHHSHFVGVLGMPGLTAYSSFYEIGKPKKGETIFISAASGAVGSIVGQLAKREGLRVIGSAGSDKKVAFLKNDLGFDAAFNYKNESPNEALRKYAPEGIDIYYDNVGGETLDAALQHGNRYARFIECGMISQYNITDKEGVYPIKNLLMLIPNRYTMRGFLVGDPEFGPKYSGEHQKNVSKWLAAGEIVSQQHVSNGLENAIEGFIGMLKGENFGKAVVKIADTN